MFIFGWTISYFWTVVYKTKRNHVHNIHICYLTVYNTMKKKWPSDKIANTPNQITWIIQWAYKSNACKVTYVLQRV